MRAIRVLVVDDQALVRAGFRMILEAEPDLEVVADAADGLEAVAAAQRHRPDVVLMDVRMPNLDGIAATRRILEGGSTTKVLMLTTFDMDEYVYEAFRAGANGFLLKDVLRRLIEGFVKRQPARALPRSVQELTAREREVLELMARGLSNAEIAETFVVSEATVKTHVSRVLDKLDLRDRVQAVVFAYEWRLVQPGERPSG